MIFRDSARVKIATQNVLDKLFYSLNGGAMQPYEGSFLLTQTTGIKALALRGGDTSSVTEGTYYKMKHPDWKVSYSYKYNTQYSGGGDAALIDGIRGDANWRKGFWQGFQGKDVEITIDMGAEKNVGSFMVSVLQDTRSWIVYPTWVEFFISSDGKKFSAGANVKNTVAPDKMDSQTQELRVSPFAPMKARYVKAVLHQYGKLPEWHPGAGGDSFIFIDEIDVK